MAIMTMSSDELYSDTTAIFDFIFDCFSEYDELLQKFIGLQESVNVMAFWRSLTHTDKCLCLIHCLIRAAIPLDNVSAVYRATQCLLDSP